MRILLASVTDSGIYRTRSEFISRLLQEGHSVTIVSPRSETADKLILMGCKFIEICIQRHGISVFEEIKVINQYRRILISEKPDAVFSYTVKPNLYLGILCRYMKINYFMNITGLGEGLMNESRTKKILLALYPIATKKAKCVFFQNKFNQDFFVKHKLAHPRSFRMLPGSGVNTEEYYPLPYPKEDNGVKFLFVSRIVKDKGVEELISAIKILKERHDNIEFHFVGGSSQAYENRVKEWHDMELITYHGHVKNILPFYEMMHCLVHPSYHEGMANVILESAACARPCIASDINGCKEGIESGRTGYLFEVKSSAAIVDTIELFLTLSNEQKALMGIAGRKKIEREFNRKIVVDTYMDEISRL